MHSRLFSTSFSHFDTLLYCLLFSDRDLIHIGIFCYFFVLLGFFSGTVTFKSSLNSSWVKCSAALNISSAAAASTMGWVSVRCLHKALPLPCLRGDFNCLQDRLKLQLLQLRPHWGGANGWSGAEVAPFRIATYQVKVKWSGSELKEFSPTGKLDSEEFSIAYGLP